ncbi:xanthine dehydrogenase family protein molybdopterin-binding subunit, partial [Gemmatimonas sp.]|uniref:xanthine dehydrogenase family protein molybdopterin-binding subunit n=1 Tax=Gemmatimonas sp. TaxID=1962908 RepID=UPI002ED82082
MRRRAFLLGGLGTGGALFLGWSLLPPRQRLRGQRAPETSADSVALNGWLTIAPDGAVTIVAPKAEMGQGIHTALAMLVVEELDCDWEQVRVVHSPIDRIYGNVAALVDGLPIHPDEEHAPLVRGVRWLTAKVARELGVMMTGGSSSVRDCWVVARQAGATAREALLSAAAEQTGIPIAECRTERGVVVCGTQRLTYGSLAAGAVRQRPSRITLKPPAQFTRIGVATPQLDARQKVEGAPLYGMDVSLADMLYAAVALPPVLGSRPLHFDQQAAMARPGVRAVVPLEGTRYGDQPGVAIIAESLWQARQALSALAIEWSPSPHAALSSDGIMSTLRDQALHGDGFAFRRSKDAQAAVSVPGARVMESLYEAPYLAHAAMEPINATARVFKDRAELWTGTQVPGFARDAMAHVTALDASQITVHQYQMGGAFGRRLEADYVAQMATIARAMPGVPVQMIWTREDDMRADFYRPAAVTRLRASLSPSGALRALVVQSASQAPFKALSQRVGFLPTTRGPDRTTAEGTWDQPY